MRERVWNVDCSLAATMRRALSIATLAWLGCTSLARADETETEPPTTVDEQAQEDTRSADPTWGSLSAGKGFLVGRTSLGELSVSAYGLIRYLDQLPADQTYIDHLGNVRPVDTRNDIYAHRVMIHLKGWIGVKELVYQFTIWTVNTTDQDAVFATVGYQFHRAFNLYGGMNGLPGSRTMLGSHPYWLGNDRVMADEYFRPYFTFGVWANGEALPGLWYTVMVGNNLSALGITAAQLTRNHAYAGSLWWMPTTGEFGPNGSFDDFEWHEELATRFGVGTTTSMEDRFAEETSRLPDNNAIRLADAVNLFETGSLAPDVTVLRARYSMLSLDAGIKYRGIFVGTAYFQRWLTDFNANGPLPVSSIVDRGFYVQAAFYPLKQRVETYGATSWVFGDKSAGFETQHEWLVGANWFFTGSRNIRLNGQLIRIDRSPVSSTFGYYVGGQLGVTATLAMMINF